MTLIIKQPEAKQLAHALAKQTGETITIAVIKALQERLLRELEKKSSANLRDEILKISHRCAMLPNRDKRSPEEIVGYDQSGLPS